MLRFGFMDESLGGGAAYSLRFPRALENELVAYVPTLRAYLEKHGADMPLVWAPRPRESGIIGL
jgi:hypothetical protein